VVVVVLLVPHYKMEGRAVQVAVLAQIVALHLPQALLALVRLDKVIMVD
jgi:hypothetical protein